MRRVEWPGPGHDSGNRMREESTNDVILVQSLLHRRVYVFCFKLLPS